MAAAGGAARAPIAKMSAEVVDTNPYSRLMALQRMGVVADYERIREKTVAIVVRDSGSAWHGARKRVARC
jgi:ubiquitin-like modifier-activating enzyme 5